MEKAGASIISTGIGWHEGVNERDDEPITSHHTTTAMLCSRGNNSCHSLLLNSCLALPYLTL